MNVAFVRETLMCSDDNLKLRGDWDSPIGSQFIIQFEKCDNSTANGTCKSDEEIREWMKSKYLYLLIN